MSDPIEFEIMYADLTEEAQKRLCKEWKTTPEAENWDILPIAEAYREIEGGIEEEYPDGDKT